MKTEDIQALAAEVAKNIKSAKDLNEFKKMLTKAAKKFESEQKRFGKFKLGLAYPEDQVEIQDAFIN